MTRMLIDTHCHLDAAEFDADREAVIARAAQARVGGMVIPAVDVAGFERVRALAHRVPGAGYALGIHPLYTGQANVDDLQILERAIELSLHDPKFVAVGEIGLDFFVPEFAQEPLRRRQILFYRQQLDLARRFGLPVIVHVRRSQDELLKHLRQGVAVGGIAHAFNGSFQQAQQFLDQGFALGFGGAMTFERSLQIRRLAAGLPLSGLVLETDAPDIPPSWLGGPGKPRERNEPCQVRRIAQTLAGLRQLSVQELETATFANAVRVLPRLPGAVSAG